LNLSLPEYPPSVPQEPVKLQEAEKQKPFVNPDRSTASVSMTPAPVQEVSVVQTPISPFVYGGFSAIVPGLGQFLLKERGKGVICFGVVGASVLGTMLAWNYTTTAYNDLQQNRSAGGTYNDSDYRKFTVRLHGSQILTGVSVALYLLNIADASADAFTIKRHPSQRKPLVTVSSTGAGCALAVTF
jgi:TM2 domain-containing membrane protein YozV